MNIIEMQATIARLADQVTRLTTDLSSLWPNVAGLLAVEDGPWHAYLGATGPAVRASSFEHALDVDRRRMKELEDTNKSLATQLVSLTDSVEHTQSKNKRRTYRSRHKRFRVPSPTSMPRPIGHRRSRTGRETIG